MNIKTRNTKKARNALRYSLLTLALLAGTQPVLADEHSSDCYYEGTDGWFYCEGATVGSSGTYFDYATAVGFTAKARERATAFGYEAKAFGFSSLALGYASFANRQFAR